ncbi:hypothetical protein AN4196.2 [Aspergillus nidulans FGSC A4]|uniref:Protein kinase domain-containing protein n=1 Tax=Emericella nidulans (strain FGSC A4 / ATCC 38163 / CBS 112.46 / NRRL 194 / M139) TaxID=227321 RepID=Q5B5I4_EMENI|nr:protein ffkF [Aspergillus nidulans FGSC A4]EAA59295.1 hypothetical protein AN4196.2 [Aspergillus nidulans FGSC A4]CBF74507.1 TPA: conserved hypothetical protein [Aspergillus nidulans FGSC A4]|eukprot:XP_661800.1 hypothetical protein AN4196.2 [Aspergillus nidulans FGSC A4]
MELSHLIVDAPASGRVGPPSWDSSFLNPRNRVDNLDTTSSRWRIDGATICGTCVYAIPLDLLPNLPPLRVLLYISDQTEYPAALRQSLDACTGVPLRDGNAISRLGLAKHLCRALDYHCAKNPGFLQEYSKLPFGSRLIFEDVTPDVADMMLYVERDYGIEKNMKTLQYLQQSWSDIAQDAWPPAVDINELRLVKQLNEAVILVEFSGQSRAIFKCASDSLHHMYHELRFLLTCPPHPHIMPRPLAVVLKKSAFGGRSGVVGFLLQYFEGGSLRDIIPARQRSATLSDTVKLRWCRQVASALTHLHEMGTFYSDLRPDNVLLDAEENAVLCDFEQRGNWYEWSPPEVLYRQYVENIRARLPERVVNSPYDHLLKEYACSHSLSTSACYTPAESPIEARNRAWFALPPSAREKATVYNFGLFIYCVFEGLSNVRRNVANQFPIEPEVEYPTFRRTPEAVRKIIQQSIGNPPDWDTSELQSRSSRVVRVNGLLYPETRTDLEPDTRQAFDAVMDTLLGFWSTELIRAERFLEGADWSAGDFGRDRASLRDVVDALESQAEDLY